MAITVTCSLVLTFWVISLQDYMQIKSEISIKKSKSKQRSCSWIKMLWETSTIIQIRLQKFT